MDTVLELYETRLKPLPVVARLQLTQLLVSDLVRSAPRRTVDYSEEWSDEDLADFTRASLAYAAESFGETDSSLDSRRYESLGTDPLRMTASK
jgi:hypothetical protein